MKSPVFPRGARALSRRALVQCGAALLALGAAQGAQRAQAAPVPERRILVIGDSQAQGLAGGFLRLYVRRPTIRVLDHSKIATGLSRNAYDWPAEVKKLVAADHADVAVVMFGANDRPNIRLHGKVDPKLSAAFTAKYAAQVTSIATTLHDAHIPVLWIGHPQVRDPVFNEDMAMLNGIFLDATTKAGADFVPLWKLFAGKDGAYDAYGKGVDGETTRLRADDGVHLSRSGYDVLARYLDARVEGPAAQK